MQLSNLMALVANGAKWGRSFFTKVEAKIADLAAIQKALKGLIAQCSKGGRGRGCPVIDALGEDHANIRIGGGD